MTNFVNFIKLFLVFFLLFKNIILKKFIKYLYLRPCLIKIKIMFKKSKRVEIVIKIVGSMNLE